MGAIDLESLYMTPNSGKGRFKVRRTANNARVRPNAQKRHDPVNENMVRSSTKHFLNNEDLEWMSLNYRKVRAAYICRSRRRMILIMF